MRYSNQMLLNLLDLPAAWWQGSLMCHESKPWGLEIIWLNGIMPSRYTRHIIYMQNRFHARVSLLAFLLCQGPGTRLICAILLSNYPSRYYQGLRMFPNISSVNYKLNFVALGINCPRVIPVTIPRCRTYREAKTVSVGLVVLNIEIIASHYIWKILPRRVRVIINIL